MGVSPRRHPPGMETGDGRGMQRDTFRSAGPIPFFHREIAIGYGTGERRPVSLSTFQRLTLRDSLRVASVLPSRVNATPITFAALLVASRRNNSSPEIGFHRRAVLSKLPDASRVPRARRRR